MTDTLTGVSDTPIEAAGAVVWRPAGDRLEVLLIHRKRYDDWSLPKGKLDPGEHAVTAAVREVHEETGVAVCLGPQLTRHRYSMQRPEGATKQVTYWAARPTDGIGAGADAYQANDEVDAVRWMDVDSAPSTLTYARDAAVLEHFVRVARVQGHRSSPLVVLRHASAKARKTWSGNDRKRPLSDEGVEQSRLLVPLLLAFGIDTVVSSDAVRCVRTVKPYAEAAGLRVDPNQRWSEESAGRSDVRTAVAAMRAGDERVVLCTHRPVLPWVFEGLGLPQVKLDPGQALVAHRWDGGIVVTELLRP